jgi:glycosyltransferase involved in cell wall biosynthesis
LQIFRRVAAVRAQLLASVQQVADLDIRLAASLSRIAALENRLDGYHAAAFERMDGLQRSLEEHERQLAVRAAMDWIKYLPPREGSLVSVILPTRNRCVLLLRAVGSVIAQTYRNWELLIVDDGSRDDTAAVIDRLNDPRIRRLRTAGAGVCAARNEALSKACGGLIAYLDDDNLMHPEWLSSIVWAFEQRPETNVLYGAFVVDDTARIDGKGRGDLPKLYYWPYDHQAVTKSNIADIGCIAHRAGLGEAHFDVSLREMGDWDLFLRLTRDAPPLGLPVIACFYTTDAPHRLSHGPTYEADFDYVREKNKR